MLIEAMAFPRQGLSSAGVQPNPGRGKKAEGVGSCPNFQAGPEVWWWQGTTSSPAPRADPSSHRISSQAPRSSSQPRRALGEQPKQIGELIPPHYQIHIDLYIEQTHVPSSELQKSQDQRVNKRLQQSVWRWWGLPSSWEGAGPALCRNLAVTRISCRKQSF